jgi:hypothetical protein
VDDMYTVGENISKISTSRMINLHAALLFTCLCYGLSYM